MNNKEKRNTVFDQYRKISENNMADEEKAQLILVVKQQEAKIKEMLEMQQQQQIQQQQLQVTLEQHKLALSQQQLMSGQSPTSNPIIDPNMSYDNIMKHFRHVSPFSGSGKNDESLLAFINSVDRALTLCEGNLALYEFALEFVVNEKIVGDAGRCIRQLTDRKDWKDIKKRLVQQFQPRKTYAEIFNNCREIKVSNLRELLDYFIKSSYEINELYNLDEDKPSIYAPLNVERDLKNLLLDKIDGSFRSHIKDDITITQLYNDYFKLRLLDDNRAISSHHRKFFINKPKNFNNKSGYHKYEQYHDKDTNNAQYKNSGQYNNRKTNYNDQFNTRQSNNRQNENFGRQRNFYDGNPFRQEREQLSGQSRWSNNNQSGRNRNVSTSQQSLGFQRPEPMEIGNIQKDVNFYTPPQNQNCP